jgi:8-oxo-dGTP pyrophosphatase MutT (NUDIX family)
MDITTKIGDVLLNSRAVVIVRHKDGYLFEKHPLGYIYPIGGRIMMGESSEVAAKREVMEEIGVELDDLKFTCILENFYIAEEKGGEKNVRVHEYSFVYESQTVLDVVLPEGFVTIKHGDIEAANIKPSVIKDMILGRESRVNIAVN